MASMIRRSLMALVLFGVLSSAPVFAQEGEETEEDRTESFRAVSGPEVERIPGGRYLVYAYGLMWVMTAAFMWRRIGSLQSKANEDLARLSAQLERQSKDS